MAGQLDMQKRRRMLPSGDYLVGYDPSLIYIARGERTFEEARAAASSWGGAPPSHSQSKEGSSVREPTGSRRSEDVRAAENAARAAEIATQAAENDTVRRSLRAMEKDLLDEKARLALQQAEIDRRSADLERGRAELERDRAELERARAEFFSERDEEIARLKRLQEEVYEVSARSAAAAAANAAAEPSLTLTTAMALKQMMVLFNPAHEDSYGEEADFGALSSPRPAHLAGAAAAAGGAVGAGGFASPRMRAGGYLAAMADSPVQEIECVRGESEAGSFAVYEDTVELARGMASQSVSQKEVAMVPRAFDGDIPLEISGDSLGDVSETAAARPAAAPTEKRAATVAPASDIAAKRASLLIPAVDPFSQESLLRQWQDASSAVQKCANYYYGKKAPGGQLWGGDESMSQTKTVEMAVTLADGTTEVEIKNEIGGSEEVHIYHVESIDNFDVDSQSEFALKVHETRQGQLSPIVWEFYIGHQLTKRLAESDRRHFLRMHLLSVYPTRCMLLTDYWEYRSLYDVVLERRQKLNEVLTVYLTIELCKAVEQLHAADVLHCSLSPKHVLLRVSLGSKTGKWCDWSVSAPAWDDYGVCLIDFSNAVDRRAFPAGQRFVGQPPVVDEVYMCAEMHDGQPWDVQSDLHGIASVVHHMLTRGEPLALTVAPATTAGSPARMAPTLEFDKFAGANVWPLFFDALLNPGCNLAATRKLLENFLSQPARAKVVRQQLVRLCATE
jgi:hypothetical protein